jgi:hypothetical protein
MAVLVESIRLDVVKSLCGVEHHHEVDEGQISRGTKQDLVRVVHGKTVDAASLWAARKTRADQPGPARDVAAGGGRENRDEPGSFGSHHPQRSAAVT